jgi:hypothetical protein
LGSSSVATLANGATTKLPEQILPATAILDEAERIPSELRGVFVAEWQKKEEKKYVRERRVRDLAHELKASAPLNEERADFDNKTEVLPDEQI